ncbi:hypothetical protein CRG98_008801 [Punica granatum]|uniref:Uncharacterized protein n=1 Tax=Punica granatum TaxID=22663 RepID=A0A2I0KSK5_PUNGR|nr:hypothetical protein CRG98_008801 [Punica granatum]
MDSAISKEWLEHSTQESVTANSTPKRRIIFPLCRKPPPRPPRQKLGNEGHSLKSRKGESWQNESINHFLARSKTLKGRPRQKSEDSRGAISPKARVIVAKGERSCEKNQIKYPARSSRISRPRQKLGDNVDLTTKERQHFSVKLHRVVVRHPPTQANSLRLSRLETRLEMGSNQRILDLEDPIRSLLLPLCTYSTGYPFQKKPFSDRDTTALQRSPIGNPRYIFT